jgi:hypothetical protein
MSALDFAMEPSFECANDNAGDVAFVNTTCSIGSRDAVEEYLACRLFPLSAGFGFREMEDEETPVSKITLPLLVVGTLLKNIWPADFFPCQPALASEKWKMRRHQCQK